jgi:hypothetical protein
MRHSMTYTVIYDGAKKQFLINVDSPAGRLEHWFEQYTFASLAINLFPQVSDEDLVAAFHLDDPELLELSDKISKINIM